MMYRIYEPFILVDKQGGNYQRVYYNPGSNTGSSNYTTIINFKGTWTR